MTKAHLLTIGTEITSGEVINSNAAWLSQQLETLGVRVLSHLTVRDQREELLTALKWPGVGGGSETEPLLVFVTGGLGPTSDDVTRACMAEHMGIDLEFDQEVWNGLNSLYAGRGLSIREAHKHQCWFPKGSERLSNPVGTALGFYSLVHSSPSHPRIAHYFALPGPPRELEGMFTKEVAPRLKHIVPKPDLTWHRWTVFAVPESEVAELIEPVIAGTGLEVGYRAQVPYVRAKLFAHGERHREILAEVSRILAPSLVAHSVDGAPSGPSHDLAEQLLSSWPDPQISVWDDVSEGLLARRLYGARRNLSAKKELPSIRIAAGGISLVMNGSGFKLELQNSRMRTSVEQILPYKMALDSDRGRHAAAEWALWLAIKALKAN